VGVRVGVAYLRIKLALRTRLRNLNLRSHFSVFDSFRDLSVHTDRRTDEQTDMARSTRLVILIKNIYTLWVYILSDVSSIPFYSTSNGYKNDRKTFKYKLLVRAQKSVTKK